MANTERPVRPQLTPMSPKNFLSQNFLTVVQRLTHRDGRESGRGSGQNPRPSPDPRRIDSKTTRIGLLRAIDHPSQPQKRPSKPHDRPTRNAGQLVRGHRFGRRRAPPEHLEDLESAPGRRGWGADFGFCGRFPVRKSVWLRGL